MFSKQSHVISESLIKGKLVHIKRSKVHFIVSGMHYPVLGSFEEENPRLVDIFEG